MRRTFMIKKWATLKLMVLSLTLFTSACLSAQTLDHNEYDFVVTQEGNGYHVGVTVKSISGLGKMSERLLYLLIFFLAIALFGHINKTGIDDLSFFCSVTLPIKLGIKIIE